MRKNEETFVIPASLLQSEDSSPSMQLPDPRLLSYYRNREARTLWLDDEVTEESALGLVRAILEYNREDADIPVEERVPIKLLIFSYGGDALSCLSLIDTIEASKTPVHTVNMGAAMSAALLILLAGHKRYCLPRSTALAHSGSGGTGGTYEQTEAQMKDYQRFVKLMRDYIMERTNIDKKTMDKNKSREWFLYAEDQVKYHVVDEIVSSTDQIK